MARPQKTGLDYFSHDVDASNDEKIESMEALYGPSGYCFYFKLLERIYRAGGELIVSDAETRQILAKKCLCSVDEWNKMLATALRIGLFDAVIYESAYALTSKGIKNRCATVVKKREIMANKYQNRVSDAETREETRQKPDKVKERIEKESKEDPKSKREPRRRFQPPTIPEISTYCAERGNGIDPEKFFAYYESNGWKVGRNPMKSWKAAVTTWEKSKNGTNQKPSQYPSAQQRKDQRLREVLAEYSGPKGGAEERDHLAVSVEPEGNPGLGYSGR